jgi:diguanylate cyclase (GGDEF)-like protein
VDPLFGVQIVSPSVDSVGVRNREGTSELLGLGPVRPLLAFLAVAFGATAVEIDGTDWSLVGVAATLAVALLAVTRLVSWRHLSETYLLLPALGTLVLVAILRQSQGGATSGYGPLVILPVVWVALTLGRRAVLVTVAATTSMFAIPIVLVGTPLYPASGWRSTALWMVVATVVGLVVASVVAEQRALAATAEHQSIALAETLAALEAVAAVARDVSSGVDARELVCAAAASCTNASLVTLIERREGEFAITGSAGLPIGLIELQGSVQPVASLSAFFSKSQVFISDVSTNPGVSPVLVEKTGLQSILYEPIMRHGAPVGVLSIGWSVHLEQVDAKTRAVVAYLAAEAGAAIERSDLVKRIEAQARTDQLTSIPNRRAWDQTLAFTLGEEWPVCVAILDIDHFKRYNDQRGHLACDRLLQECAAAWSRQLRPGDLLARYGGEEFAVLLRDCSLQGATAVLQRVRAATPTGATCSVGVAQRRASDTATELVARADAALYEAKRAGRDRLKAA